MFKKMRKIWLLVIMLIFMLTVEVVNNQVLSMTYKKYEIENVSEENYSEGLEYTLNDEKTGYIVTGIGTCEDTEIIIPNTYEGLPVVSIGEFAFIDCQNLTSIIISNSVTSIGLAAFEECISLTSITIPESITSIGESAFSHCTSLKEVFFEENSQLVSIGDYAFFLCTNLTSIVIPSSVTSIASSAFLGCENLEMVIFEENSQLISIGESAFSNCTSLEEVIFKENSQLTSIESGVFSNCYNLTTIKIPNSVTSIGAGAFYCCTSLKEVIFEENSQLTSIGNSVFQKCISLESIEIPNSVTSIDDAFSNCESLTNITIPDSVTSIGAFTFDHCVSLTNINVDPNNEYYKSIDGVLYSKDEKTLIRYPEGKEDSSFIVPNSVTSVGDCSFSNCESLTSIEIPNSVTILGNCAFFECTNLTSIEIPDSVTFIGADVFRLCYDLTNINVDPNNEYYKSIDGVLYSKDGKTLIQYPIGKEDPSFVIPNGVASIDWNAFYNCLSLISIEISDSVTSIGYGAFGNCSNLTKIVIPNSVTYIDNAFYNCPNLTIYCEAESQPDGWDENWNSSNCPVIWGYCEHNIEHVSNKEATCTEDGNKEYWYCNKCNNYYDDNNCINEMDIGSIIIQALGHNYTGGKCIICGDDDLNYGDQFSEGLEFTLNADKNSYTVTGIGECTDTELIIPSEYNNFPVVSIGEDAFSDCTNLISVKIPTTVTSIGHSAFKNCNKIEKMEIPFGGLKLLSSNRVTPGSPVSTVHLGYFFGATYSNKNFVNNCVPASLKEVIVTGSGEIKTESFRYCENIERVIFLDDVTNISSSMFDGCKKLSEVIMTNNITNIGAYAFSNCTSLKTISLSNSITEIKLYTFSGCTSLESIIIPNSVTSIGERSFSGCTSLKNIIIHNKVTDIFAYAFSGCENLTIYCESAYKLSTWDENWNSTNCPVVWGYIEPTYIPGDLNKDDIVDTNDVIYLLMHTYFSEQYPVEQDCDYNNDNVVDTNDVIYLLMHTYFPDTYPLE